LKLLHDPDGFVISRAAITLGSFHLPYANDAILKAIHEHPSLAIDLMGEIRLDNDMGQMILPAIRRLVTQGDPQIRAAAIHAVCELAPQDAGAEIGIGIKDPDPSVRRAAVRGLVNAIQSNGIPDWLEDLQPQLEPLLSDPDNQTRISAAVALCALGQSGKCWQLVREGASEENAATEAIALSFLDWPRRQELFDALVKVTPDGQMPLLIQNFSRSPDLLAAVPLWNILSDPRRDGLLSSVHQALLATYGQQNNSVVHVTEMTSNANAYLARGNDLQKTEALCLLAAAFLNDQASKAASQIAFDKKSTAALRQDAMQILLTVSPDDQAIPIAEQNLSDPLLRKICASYLALGKQAVCQIRNSIYLNYQSTYGNTTIDVSDGQTQVIQVPVPAGLTAEPLRKLLPDSDPETAGYLGYLLAILGDSSGFDNLLKQARSNGLDGDWGQLLYRAIAKLDDDSKTPILAEIYHSYANSNWQIRDFYWTIRAMHGPQILKLRKQIRTEIGMEQLQ
jgi:HEAT repeat protein